MASAATSSGTAALPALTNVLSKAKSPYLLQHAKNPVAVSRSDVG